MTKSIMKPYKDVLVVYLIQFSNANKHVILVVIHGWCQNISMFPKDILNIDT